MSATIDAYMSRLRLLADEADSPSDRFFLFTNDDELYELEALIADSPLSDRFYEVLKEQLRAWRDQMGAEGWEEIVARNDSLNGANRNWLIYEL